MNAPTKPIRFYYVEDNKKVILDNATGDFGEHSCDETSSTTLYNYFELFKDFEKTKEDLTRFKKKFLADCQQLKGYGIYYEKYYNHYNAVSLTFMRYAKRILENYSIPDVNIMEYDFIEKCYNAGIMYLDEKNKMKTIQSYGYDYSSFYPNVLMNKQMLLPKKQGRKTYLQELTYNNLQYGIYRVNITSSNPNIKKVFAFSKKGYYTHYDLQFIYKYKDLFQASLELKTDCEYNALLYDELMPCSTIFKDWYEKLSNVKKQCKGNILAKHLFSSLWGTICKFDVQYVSDEKLESLDCSLDDIESEYLLIDYQVFTNGNSRNKIIKTAKPYKYNLGRLKPFVVALSRNIVGEFILENDLLDNVIRVHTDNITTDCELEIPDDGYYPIPEEKTTGEIEWVNVNNGLKFCNECNKKYKHTDKHLCVLNCD